MGITGEMGERNVKLQRSQKWGEEKRYTNGPSLFARVPLSVGVVV